jgi:uncharacterized protein (TIGR03086 family)
MDEPELIAAATARATAVARAIRPDQLDLPTPCGEWDVRRLVNHLVYWAGIVSERMARKEPMPTEAEVTEDTDHTAGDFAGRFAEHAGQAARAWAEPGALKGPTEMAGTSMPAEQAAALMLGELVVHGWDLAVATGQAYDCAPDVAERMVAVLAGIAPMGRSYGVFGDEVPVPGDARALDRALGLSGRDPAWSPGQLTSSAQTRQSSSTP